MTPSLPSGTVTFLLTDIEGSTALFRELGRDYAAVVAEHNRLIRDALAAHGGVEVKTVGDAFIAAFADAGDALAAAAAASHSLVPTGLKVRMGLHTGEAVPDDGDYVAFALHQAARIGDAGNGGQIVVSARTAAEAGERLPAGAVLTALGRFRVRDFDDPVELFQLCPAGVEVDVRPLRVPPPDRHNIPVVAGRFVGRRVALTELGRLIGTERITTLVGPGGTGKTRLALEAAAAVAGRYPDGVWVALLSPVVAGGDIRPTIADAVSAAPRPGERALDAIVRHLSPQRCLLVIDNCEHVVDDAARVIEHVVAACPKVDVLATSRHPLELRGEQQYPVPALDVPPERVGSAAEVLDHDAVRLLVDRLRLVDPHVAVDAAALAPIVEICRLLDGVPLALELAAARTRTIPVARLASDLRHALPELAGGYRTDEPRQRSLRGALDWSHELLEPAERVLFRRLSVFRGGWPLGAAEAVAGTPPLRPGAVGAVIDALVRHSLVVGADANGRYRSLEFVRQYAGERLDEAGETDELRAGHLGWVGSLAPTPGVQFDIGPMTDEISREVDNIRAAVVAAGDDRAETRSAQVGVVTRLRSWFDITDRQREGADLVTALLAPDDGAALPADVLADAVGTLVLLQRNAGLGIDQLGALAERAVALARAVGDPGRLASALLTAGGVANDRDEYDCSVDLLREALAEAQRAGTPELIAAAWWNVASVEKERGRLDEADVAAVACEAVAVTTLQRAWAIAVRGQIAGRRGDFDAGRRLLTDALATVDAATSGQRARRTFLRHLAKNEARAGRLDAARDCWSEALAGYDTVDDAVGRGWCLQGLADVAIAAGDVDGARRLLERTFVEATRAGDDMTADEAHALLTSLGE